MGAGANPWLPRRRAADARLRLFCFPFAGGGSAVFHGLARHVRGAIEIAPVLLPGRERRLDETPVRAMDQLVPRLEQALEGELARPHAFLGHSLGALVAFELARRRRARGLPGPEHLVVSAARAPHLLSIERPIHGLPNEQFLDAVEAKGGMPPEVRGHSELLELVLPALRADFELYETYRFVPGTTEGAVPGTTKGTVPDTTEGTVPGTTSSAALECPITAIGGEGDREVPRAELEAWGALTRGAFTAHWLPGGHFFLPEQAQGVARILEEQLAPWTGAPM